ncbi:hypothetical protein HanRHA438_Chr00c10g0848281 [Helianthus annuus]|nr:hypothetical protein HanRHA438_Chr00c10g0848281 [Helianthus annuus]
MMVFQPINSRSGPSSQITTIIPIGFQIYIVFSKLSDVLLSGLQSFQICILLRSYQNGGDATRW